MTLWYLSPAATPYALFDPRRLPPLDRALATAIVRAQVSATGPADSHLPSNDARATRDALETRILIVVDREIGTWATGFAWSPIRGGLSPGYCCSGDSLLRETDASPEDTTRRVVAAIVAWREQLDTIDALLEATSAPLRHLPLPTQLEHAVVALLPFCLEETGGGEDWQDSLPTLLRWYVDRLGEDGQRLAQVIATTGSGSFTSFFSPSHAEREAAGVALRQAALSRLREAPGDGLDAWIRTRGQKPWAALVLAPVPVEGDAHLAFVGARDGLHDPARGERMRRALLACRHAAARSVPLTFALLAEWQAIVLGRPAPFRTSPAFTKDGRETYGFDAQTKPRFERWLAEAQRKKEPLCFRAARLYLDVCFTHPFEDGNARSARLALDYLLTRSGLTLQLAEPIFCLTRAPDDAAGLLGLARVLTRTAGLVDD